MISMKNKYCVKDYLGKKIGKWTILEDAGIIEKSGAKGVKCRCECGKEMIKSLAWLINRAKEDTGCKECMINHKFSGIRKGTGNNKDIPLEIYRMWVGMNARCYNTKNPGYKRCGGIGITVYNEWKDDVFVFYEWAKDMGFKPNNNMRMSRIDLNKDFDPNNCKIIQEPDPKDYIGKRFGTFVILGLGTCKCKAADKYMSCQCDCGHITNIRLGMLLNKKITTCAYCKANKHFGRTKHSLYSIYRRIKNRCYNSKDRNYCNYGGRGIKMCDEWFNDYNVFYDWAICNGYKERLSIDRISVNGNYCPENCRWATSLQQAANKRKLRRNTSGYTGIIASIVKNRFFGWISLISINNKTEYLGKYNTQKEALEVRNKYIIDNKLDHPIQNYIGEIGRYTESDLGKLIKNYKKISSSKNKYTGVYLTKLYDEYRYVATIHYKKTRIQVGRFKTEKEALEARNKYIIDHNLEYPTQEYKGEIGEKKD